MFDYDDVRRGVTAMITSRGRNRWILLVLVIIAVSFISTFSLDRVVNLNVARECSTQERRRMQQYIDNKTRPNAAWNKPRPKAAIHYLVQSYPEAIHNLIHSLQALDKYFNNKFHYPVILFHEGDFTEELRTRVKGATESHLIFQNVSFTIPDFIERPVPKYVYGKNIGYRHMCRFQAKIIYEHPIMRGLDYVWRLDDDSLLRSEIPYDIFRYMSDNDLMYGYIQINYESRRRSRGLWPLVRKYIEMNQIKTQNFEEWPVRQQFYNNFEVSSTKLWYSKEYEDYVNMVDKAGGIYHHVWGDATIKTIAVNMFVPPSKTHYFCDIGYEHETLTKQSW